MPKAAPYFNKASIESGPGVRMYTPDMAAKTTELVLKALDIAPKDWRKLLDVSPAQLLDVQSKFPPIPPHQEKTKTGGITEPFPGGFGPVVDGVNLPSHPFDPSAPDVSRDKPLMVGWNEDEYTFFAWQRGDTSGFDLDFEALQAKLEPQYGTDTDAVIATYRDAMPDASAVDIFVAVSSVTMMGLGSVDIAEKKARQNAAPVYLYHFGYKSEAIIPGTDYPLGTPHAMDITFKFNNETPEQDIGFLSGNRVDRFIASHKMAELWATFAKTGTPAAVDVPQWSAFDLNKRASMRLDTECTLHYDRYHKELAMWRRIGRL
jgi:para-nitrobenzyl esterase